MTWWAPIVLVREDKLNFSKTGPIAWMKNKELNLNGMPGKEHFLIVNPEEIGKFIFWLKCDKWEG